jgi:hypothetical protein
MKLLALTAEPIASADLRNALPPDVDPDHVEVMVVAPALQDSALRFWFSDADDAISRADQVRRESVERLGDDGVSAAGDTGESDTMRAVEDALQTFPAERILIFTHPEEDQRYREDVDVEELRARFGLPVDRAEITGSDGSA